MKIGILSPRSKVYPTIARDLMNGLKTYLEKQKLIEQVEILNESVGFGGSEKEVYEKAEQLLIIEDVDVLLAYIDERILDFLQPLLYSSGKLIIIINPGANYLVNWVPQPNVIHLTLQHSFCCWLTGVLAKNKYDDNNNAVIATTFYDCGYLHSAAMVKSFLKRKGNVAYNYINNQKYDDLFHINELITFLSQHTDVKKILCQFDTLPASMFYKLLNEYEGAEKLNLFTSPMMIQENIFENQEPGFKFPIQGYVPWLSSLPGASNIDFKNSIKEKTKNEANIFSLLGWESAIIVEQLLLHSSKNFDDGESLAMQLKKIKLNTPRGELVLDDSTQFYISTPYKGLIKPHTNKIEIKPLKNYDDEWKLFTEEPTQGYVAGWTNTYLCY